MELINNETIYTVKINRADLRRIMVALVDSPIKSPGITQLLGNIQGILNGKVGL